jgi:large subunit ribosomal protein L15
MPIYRRLPKRGFNKPNAVAYNEINIAAVARAIEAKKINTAAPVTLEVLVAAGVITRPKAGVRLLGKGELKSKVAFEVYHASKGAIAAVEKAGGSVKLLKPAAPAPAAS